MTNEEDAKKKAKQPDNNSSKQKAKPSPPPTWKELEKEIDDRDVHFRNERDDWQKKAIPQIASSVSDTVLKKMDTLEQKHMDRATQFMAMIQQKRGEVYLSELKEGVKPFTKFPIFSKLLLNTLILWGIALAFTVTASVLFWLASDKNEIIGAVAGITVTTVFAGLFVFLVNKIMLQSLTLQKLKLWLMNIFMPPEVEYQYEQQMAQEQAQGAQPAPQQTPAPVPQPTPQAPPQMQTQQPPP